MEYGKKMCQAAPAARQQQKSKSANAKYVKIPKIS